MYEFPGESRKAGVHMPPWNPLEGRPCIYLYTNLFRFTGHAMILIFIVLVSIILMNLLVGLAVSDIQVLIVY